MSDLLMELRARRDPAALPAADVLYVEWLLLQNPRAEFLRRPRLPGQEHPGLGLLREVVGLLVVMCDRLGLDGILFVPAHYYMAALGRRHLRFLSPEDAAVYEALRNAVAELSLAAATRAIEDGRVVDSASGEVIWWHTPPMVMALSKRLEEQLGAVAASAVSDATDLPTYELKTPT